MPDLAEIEARDPHLRRASVALVSKQRLHPDLCRLQPDRRPRLRGREFLMALTGLNSRGYKNSTLLFNLARRLHRALAGPRADQPALARHCRADVGAGADPPSLGLLRRVLHRGAVELRRNRTCLRGPGQRRAPRHRRHGRFLRRHQQGRGPCAATARRSTSSPRCRRLPHPRFSRFFAQIKQDLGFGIYVPDCDTTACSFSAATQAGSTDPILGQPLLDFYAGYQVGDGSNEPRVTRAAQRQHRL